MQQKTVATTRGLTLLCVLRNAIIAYAEASNAAILKEVKAMRMAGNVSSHDKSGESLSRLEGAISHCVSKIDKLSLHGNPEFISEEDKDTPCLSITPISLDADGECISVLDEQNEDNLQQETDGKTFALQTKSLFGPSLQGAGNQDSQLVRCQSDVEGHADI